MADFCELGNEPSCYIKLGDFLPALALYRLVRNDLSWLRPVDSRNVAVTARLLLSSLPIAIHVNFDIKHFFSTHLKEVFTKR